MKKLFLLLVLLLFALPSYATYWYEFFHKSYVDLDTIQKTNNIGLVWVKSLNDNDIEPINNKKIWYTLSRIYIDLKNKKIGLKDAYFYDLNNNLVENYELEEFKWDIVIPSSMGEALYNIVYKYPRLKNFTDKQHWVKVTEDTYLDINSLLLTNSECCNMWLKMDAKNFTDVKRKTKYVKTFVSVNLIKHQAAILELKEYDVNNKLLKHQKFYNLNYKNIGEDGVLYSVVKFIDKLTDELNKQNNN